jgi:hypothetical protein
MARNLHTLRILAQIPIQNGTQVIEDSGRVISRDVLSMRPEVPHVSDRVDPREYPALDSSGELIVGKHVTQKLFLGRLTHLC